MSSLRKKITSLVSTSTLLFALLSAIPISFTLPSSTAYAATTDSCDGSYTNTTSKIKVTAQHGKIFYIDSGQGQNIDAAYVSYKIDNTDTGADRENIWATLDGFAGGVVQLANPLDQSLPVGAINRSSSKPAFFLLKASTSSLRPQSHVVRIYSGNPRLAGSTELYSCTYTFLKVAQTIKAAANKVTAISSTVTSKKVGESFTITVEGATGTLGAGNSIDGPSIWVTPAARSSWPTSALRLTSTSFDLFDKSARNSNDRISTYPKTDTLRFSFANSGGKYFYTAVYTFQILAPAGSAVALTPVGQISSGTQTKHTDLGSLPTTGSNITTINLSTATVATKLTKSLSTTTAYSAGTTTFDYTLTLDNTAAGAAGVTVDAVVDNPDSQLSYVAGSAKFNGANMSVPPSYSLDNPSQFIFSGPFSVPAGTTRLITYKMQKTSCSSGSYSLTNSAYAKIGSVVLGSNATSFTQIVASGTCGTSTTSAEATNQTFSTLVLTYPASSVTTSAATLNGAINSYGVAGSTISFEYWQSGGSVTTVTAAQSPTTSSSSMVLVSYAISSGLSSGTTYFFRMKIGSTYGTTESFVTNEVTAASVAVTKNASSVGVTSAVLNGSIDPNQQTISEVRFIYGTDSQLSGATSVILYEEKEAQNDPDVKVTLTGPSPFDLALSLTGLDTTTTYYFRIQADYTTSSLQTVSGDILSFRTGTTAQTITFAALIDKPRTDNTYTIVAATTTSNLTITYVSETSSVCTIDSATRVVTFVSVGFCTITASQDGNSTYAAAEPVTQTFEILPAAPTATTQAASSITSTTATLNGSIGVGGSTSTSVSFTYALNSALTTTPITVTAAESPRTNDGVGSYALTGLTPATTYHFKIFGTNSAGTTSGLTLNFTTLAVYTITYDRNFTGKPSDTTTSVDAGIDVLLTKPSDPTRTGYTFGGWSLDGVTSPLSTYLASQNQTLKAIWTINQYTVVYNGNGESSGSVPVDASSPYNFNATITVLGNSGTLAKTGHTFGGWNTTANGSGTSQAAASTFTLGAANVTLYAQWIADGAKTITFNKNDGSNTLGTQSASTTTAISSSSAIRTRTGYTFGGWNNQADGLGIRNFAESVGTTDTYDFGADITLYAKWVPVTYAVTYNANSSTSGTVPADQSKTHAVDLTLQTNSGTLARTGYTFADWNTQANGSGTSYSSGASYTTNANLTLYAKWTINTYTVTYDGNGETSGSVPVDGSSPYNYNSTVTVLGNSGTLAKTGYTFAAWNTAANGTGTSQATATTFTLGAANVTLYAQWTANSSPAPAPAPGPEPQPAPAPAPKVKPVIEWKNPNAIKTTTTLSTTQLNAIAKPSTASSNGIAGSYVYTPIVPTVVTSGVTQITTITSAQTALTGTTKALDPTTPTTPSNPTSPSSVTEKPVLGQGTTLAPGLQKMKVVFIPADSTTYEPVETEVEILVQAETKVNWVDPAPIKKTTPVGPGQLNATGIAPGLSNNVPGTYKYDIPEGTTLPPGKYPVKVTFTPNDPNYLPSTGEVVITVIADINPLATPIITPSNTPAGKPITNTTAAANAKVTTVGKGLTTATTDGTQVNIVPLVNFSGKTTVTVSVTDEGETKDVVVPVTVLPLPAATPVATPNTKGKSTIAWKPSPNAIEYEVSLGGKSICTTSATSCSTTALIGPKSDVKIVAKGNDETVAPIAQAKYTAPKKPVTALVVYFDTNKFNLDAKDRADIRAVAKIIIEQGFKNIVVNGHTDIRGGVDNQVLSRNRSNATFNYLKELVPGLNVTIGAFASTKPAVKGTSAEALASNRRAEVGVY